MHVTEDRNDVDNNISRYYYTIKSAIFTICMICTYYYFLLYWISENFSYSYKKKIYLHCSCNRIKNRVKGDHLLETCLCNQSARWPVLAGYPTEDKTKMRFNEPFQRVRLEYNNNNNMLQKELEKEIKKMADKQTDLSADIQSMRKDMSFEFDKHNSSQNAFKKQLQVKNKTKNAIYIYKYQTS